MKHILQVLRFEYIGCVKTKSFIISTAIFMVLIVLIAFLPGLLFSTQSGNGDVHFTDKEKPVIAVCDKAYDSHEMLTAELTMAYAGYDIRMTDENLSELTAKVGTGEYRFALLLKEPLSCTYITKNNEVFSGATVQLKEILTKLYQTTQLQKAGLSLDASLEVVNAEVKLDTVTSGTDQAQNYWSTYILMMLLYIAIVMYGQMVSQSVVAEKNTRAMEMLITCAKPSHLMFGKVIGSGLAGLTQMVLIVSTALVSVNAVSKDSLPPEIMGLLNFSVDMVLYALLFFVLGYFIYSFLLGALASMASRSEDLNTLISPVMILVVAAFMVVVFSITSGDVNSTLMVVCSYIPFTAPLAIFARIAMSDVAVWEILLSVGVQLVSVYLFGKLAAAIYRIGVLMYGNPPKPAEIIKMLQEQHKTNKLTKQSSRS